MAETINKYTHGFRKLNVAQVTTDGTDDAVPVYSDYTQLIGEVSLSASDGSSSQTIYAGDTDYDEVFGKPKYEGTLSVYGELPLEVEKWMLGHELDAAGNPSLTDTRNRSFFACAYQVQGKSEPEDIVWYKALVTKEPDENPETDTDSVNAKTHDYSVKFYEMNFKGKGYTRTKVKESVDATGFANFFTKVHDPTSKATTTKASSTSA